MFLEALNLVGGGRSGRVVEEGTHKDLVQAKGLYARMWKDYSQAVNWRITQTDPAAAVSAEKEVQ